VPCLAFSWVVDGRLATLLFAKVQTRLVKRVWVSPKHRRRLPGTDSEDRVLRQGISSRYGSSSGCHHDNESSVPPPLLDTSLGMFKLRAEPVGSLPYPPDGAVPSATLSCAMIVGVRYSSFVIAR